MLYTTYIWELVGSNIYFRYLSRNYDSMVEKISARYEDGSWVFPGKGEEKLTAVENTPVNEYQKEIKKVTVSWEINTRVLSLAIYELKSCHMKKGQLLKIKTKEGKKEELSFLQIIKLVWDRTSISEEWIGGQVKKLIKIIDKKDLMYLQWYIYSDPNFPSWVALEELQKYIVSKKSIWEEFLWNLVENLSTEGIEEIINLPNDQSNLKLQKVREYIELRREKKSETDMITTTTNEIQEELWVHAIETKEWVKPISEEEKRLLCEFDAQDTLETISITTENTEVFMRNFWELWEAYQEKVLKGFKMLQSRYEWSPGDNLLVAQPMKSLSKAMTTVYRTSATQYNILDNRFKLMRAKWQEITSDLRTKYLNSRENMRLYQAIWNTIALDDLLTFNSSYLTSPSHFLITQRWSISSQISENLVPNFSSLNYTDYEKLDTVVYMSDDRINNILWNTGWIVPSLNRPICGLKQTQVFESGWTFGQKRELLDQYLSILPQPNDLWYDEKQVLIYKITLMKLLMCSKDDMSKPSLFAIQLWAKELKDKHKRILTLAEKWHHMSESYDPLNEWGSPITWWANPLQDVIELLDEILDSTDNKFAPVQFWKWMTTGLESTKVPFFGSLVNMDIHSRVSKLYEQQASGETLPEDQKVYLDAMILFGQKQKIDLWSIFNVGNSVQWSLTFMAEMVCMSPLLKAVQLPVKAWSSVLQRVLLKWAEIWAKWLAATAINSPRTVHDVVMRMKDEYGVVFFPWIDGWVVKTEKKWEKLWKAFTRVIAQSPINYSIEMAGGTLFTRTKWYLTQQVQTIGRWPWWQAIIKDFFEKLLDGTLKPKKSGLSEAAAWDGVVPEMFEEYLQKIVDNGFEWKSLLETTAREQLETLATVCIIQWWMKSPSLITEGIKYALNPKVTKDQQYVILSVWNDSQKDSVEIPIALYNELLWESQIVWENIDTIVLTQQQIIAVLTKYQTENNIHLAPKTAAYIFMIFGKETEIHEQTELIDDVDVNEYTDQKRNLPLGYTWEDVRENYSENLSDKKRKRRIKSLIKWLWIKVSKDTLQTIIEIAYHAHTHRNRRLFWDFILDELWNSTWIDKMHPEDKKLEYTYLLKSLNNLPWLNQYQAIALAKALMFSGLCGRVEEKFEPGYFKDKEKVRVDLQAFADANGVPIWAMTAGSTYTWASGVTSVWLAMSFDKYLLIAKNQLWASGKADALRKLRVLLWLELNESYFLNIENIQNDLQAYANALSKTIGELTSTLIRRQLALLSNGMTLTWKRYLEAAEKALWTSWWPDTMNKLKDLVWFGKLNKKYFKNKEKVKWDLEAFAQSIGCTIADLALGTTKKKLAAARVWNGVSITFERYLEKAYIALWLTKRSEALDALRNLIEVVVEFNDGYFESKQNVRTDLEAYAEKLWTTVWELSANMILRIRATVSNWKTVSWRKYLGYVAQAWWTTSNNDTMELLKDFVGKELTKDYYTNERNIKQDLQTFATALWKNIGELNSKNIEKTTVVVSNGKSLTWKTYLNYACKVLWVLSRSDMMSNLKDLIGFELSAKYFNDREMIVPDLLAYSKAVGKEVSKLNIKDIISIRVRLSNWQTLTWKSYLRVAWTAWWISSDLQVLNKLKKVASIEVKEEAVKNIWLEWLPSWYSWEKVAENKTLERWNVRDKRVDELLKFIWIDTSISHIQFLKLLRLFWKVHNNHNDYQEWVYIPEAESVGVLIEQLTLDAKWRKYEDLKDGLMEIWLDADVAKKLAKLSMKSWLCGKPRKWLIWYAELLKKRYLTKSRDLSPEIKKTVLSELSVNDIKLLNNTSGINNLNNIFRSNMDAQEVVNAFKIMIEIKKWITVKSNLSIWRMLNIVKLIQKRDIDCNVYISLYNKYYKNFSKIFKNASTIRWWNPGIMDVFNGVLRLYEVDRSVAILEELIQAHTEIWKLFPQIQWYSYSYMNHMINNMNILSETEDIKSFTKFFIISQQSKQLPRALKNLISFKVLWGVPGFQGSESVAFRAANNDFTANRNYNIVYSDVIQWLIKSNSSELKVLLWSLLDIFNSSFESLSTEQIELIGVLYRMRTWVSLSTAEEIQQIFITLESLKGRIVGKVMWWKQLWEVLDSMKDISSQKTEKSRYFVDNGIILTKKPRSIRWDSYKYFTEYLDNWVTATTLHWIWSGRSVRHVVDGDMSSLWINTYWIDGILNSTMLEEEITYWDGILIIADVSQEWFEITKHNWDRISNEKTEAYVSYRNPAMNQFIIRGVLPSTQIDAFVIQKRFLEKYWKKWLQDMKKAVVENWFYIPIYDSNLELLFDYQEYQKLESDLEK